MKKIFLLFLSFLTSIGTIFAIDVQIGDLYYYLDTDEQTAKVIPNPNGMYSGDISIPSTVTYNSVAYSVTTINYAAFRSCTGLTSVTFPDNLTLIWQNAFEGCTGLTSVTIPCNVITIGIDAFKSCSALTSVTINSNAIASSTYAFGASLGNIFGNQVIDYILGDSITNIGESAFNGCSGLKNVAISDSVLSIGAHAFDGCKSLTSITIPNKVTSIGTYAFTSCSGLTSVTLGNRVVNIDAWAFSGCSALTSITIPRSVTSLGMGAFCYCSNMTSITNYASTPQSLGSNAFYSVRTSIPLYVPAASIDLYRAANGWKDFKNILPIERVTETETAEIVTETTASTVTITWPQVSGADMYEIVINDAEENVICTYTFDSQGYLLSGLFYAPSKNRAPQQTQAAGFAYTIIGLTSGTTYSYELTAKDSNGNVLNTDTGSFATQSDESTAFENVAAKYGRTRKIFRNGQIFILRGDKTYTITGAEVK